jgi:excisionase family DNA binding protein
VSTPKIQTYTVPQACALLAVSRSTLDRLVRKKILKKTKLLGRVLFRQSELEKLLDHATR